MKLNKVRELASKTLKVGKKRIKIIDPEQANQAITREDIRTLRKDGAIKIKPKKGTSRGRARKQKEKKKKGRKRGPGKRKGTKKTREKKKKKWMTKVRAQRKKLKAKKPSSYRKIYKMVKGGYFKSLKHLQSYIKLEE